MNKPRDANFDNYVLRIHQVLDQLDYYRLLGLDPSANAGAVKKAFYKIAAKFHPDRNRDAEQTVHQALYDIFKRLNEAYRVLSHPGQRKLYDQARSQGAVRLDAEGRRASGPKKPEDTIKSPKARQFYLQAAASFEEGKILQADLHIQVARMNEPNAAAIEALYQKIVQAKRGNSR